jgi:hypothetical protein
VSFLYLAGFVTFFMIFVDKVVEVVMVKVLHPSVLYGGALIVSFVVTLVTGLAQPGLVAPSAVMVAIFLIAILDWLNRAGSEIQTIRRR